MPDLQVNELLVPENPSVASPKSESLKLGSAQIYIDDNGVHDFDLRHRQGTAGSQKLKKFGRCSVRSVSSMAEIERPSSACSDKSLRKRLSTFLTGYSDGSPNTSGKSHKSTSSLDSKYDSQQDPLPDTRKDLEIRLNYHLSELDLLKQTIRGANDVVRQHQERSLLLEMRSPADMKQSMKIHSLLVQQARNNRNAYANFVDYHRKQLERIKFKRIEIEEAAGLEPTLPEVYKNLWADDDWATLFRP